MPEKNSPITTGAERARTSPQSFLWTSLGYGLMVVAAIALLVLICKQGETLQAPSDPNFTVLRGSVAEAPNVLLRVLIALTAVIVVGLILAKCLPMWGSLRSSAR